MVYRPGQALSEPGCGPGRCNPHRYPGRIQRFVRPPLTGRRSPASPPLFPPRSLGRYREGRRGAARTRAFSQKLSLRPHHKTDSNRRFGFPPVPPGGPLLRRYKHGYGGQGRFPRLFPVLWHSLFPLFPVPVIPPSLRRPSPMPGRLLPFHAAPRWYGCPPPRPGRCAVKYPPPDIPGNPAGWCRLHRGQGFCPLSLPAGYQLLHKVPFAPPPHPYPGHGGRDSSHSVSPFPPVPAGLPHKAALGSGKGSPLPPPESPGAGGYGTGACQNRLWSVPFPPGKGRLAG